jgi:hypothetical protein
MKAKHTEGNWHSHDGQIYPQETGKTLALIPYFDKESEEQQANAKLIAAAPELLEAAKKCWEWFILNHKSKKIPLDGGVGTPSFLELLRGAISSATN